jgi:excisionase family DNA binding protein
MRDAPSSEARARGLTVRETARYLRIGRDRVRDLIRRGELGALNTAARRGGKPRYIVLPVHLEEFARRCRAVPAPKPRRRRPTPIDYYPD